MTPEQVAAQMEGLGFYKGHNGNLDECWFKDIGNDDFYEIGNNEATFLCQTIQDRVAEARKEWLQQELDTDADLDKLFADVARDTVALDDERTAQTWSENVGTAKLTLKTAFQGQHRKGHLKGIRHQKTYCIGLHFTQQEVDAKIAEALEWSLEACGGRNIVIKERIAQLKNGEKE